jgi:uncharacterized protein YbjT (DUF2867 family)
MILVTGGTGFIGQALIRHLVEMGYPVRTLIRPSSHSPKLPRGVPVEVAVSSLADERGLRAAMVGVDTVFHLVGGEWRGTRASLMDIDVQSTRAVVRAAEDARIGRIFFLSHLGADRASAYPVLKAKAIAEEHIRRSDVNFTILRSAIVFGPNDGFTTGIARIMHSLPFFFLTPGDGNTLLQPIWVEDLVACMTWAMEDNVFINQTIEMGGPEYLSFRQISEQVMDASGIRRRLVSVRPPYLRALTVLLEHLLPGFPVSVYWLDYLATNRTCALDSLPRKFNLMPARLSQRLAYLHGQNWRLSLVRALLRKPVY